MPGLVPDAIEELLRLTSPVQGLARAESAPGAGPAQVGRVTGDPPTAQPASERIP